MIGIFGNKTAVRLNASMFAGFVAAFVSAAIVSNYAADTEHHVNTSLAVAVDYAMYIGIFSLAYYALNRSTYSKDSPSSVRRDIIRLITSMGAAEIVYAVMRWTTHYYLLEIEYDPYIASMISQLGSTAVYFMVANMVAKLTGMFRAK